MQPQPSSPTSFSMSPRQHLRLRDIKTIARLMGRFIKVEKEVILRLLRIAKEKLQPSSPDSSDRPPKHKLRLRDMKTLARLMVRLTEVEKEVISRLLHIAEEKGKEIKQESTEVEVIPDKDSEAAPMIEATNIEDRNDESKSM